METLPETAWWGRTPRNCLSNGLVRSVQLALELNRDVTEPFSCSGRRNFTGIVVVSFPSVFFSLGAFGTKETAQPIPKERLLSLRFSRELKHPPEAHFSRRPEAN